jgi:Na+/H+ antiporter NhaD/arsenite permease-like protein/CBS domain-containing protein
MSEQFVGNDAVKQLLSPFTKVYSTQTVDVVIKAMIQNQKGSSIVLDEDNNLAGIFTERDFVRKVLDMNKTSAEVTIADVMTPVGSLIFGSEDTSLLECRQIMLNANFRHLPILSNDKRPLGIISMREIIRSLQQEDLARESSTLQGNNLEDIEIQAKRRANELALEPATSRQDQIRTAFVLTGAAVGVALVQGQWVHDHEYLAMIATFTLGYIGIVFETYFEFNKAGLSLLMAASLWVIFGDSGVAPATLVTDLSEKISEVSEVVYFILGAMTIVEIVDAHQGFKVVTDRIKADDKRGLMWVLGLITFFMSAILDNLTTTIVMVSLCKKLLPDSMDRKLFGAMIVIAANAGGAWTPIGDVTTTMLWINGQISAIPTITGLFLPSLVSVITAIFFLVKQIPEGTPVPERAVAQSELAPRGMLVFGTGIAGLLSVPVFKATTGLPPYLGMLAALGVMWSLTDIIHAGEDSREDLMAPAALKKIDTSGVLFFLGILLSVAALDSAGILRTLAEFLDATFPSTEIVAVLIGIVSALIDNVPLVAATMGMYDIAKVPMDSELWQLIAFCAGTGGSLLVIGSAAGVALMGLEKVDFVWYAKKITLPAAAGYFGGIGCYLATHALNLNFLASASTVATEVASLTTTFFNHL